MGQGGSVAGTAAALADLMNATIQIFADWVIRHWECVEFQYNFLL